MDATTKWWVRRRVAKPDAPVAKATAAGQQTADAIRDKDLSVSVQPEPKLSVTIRETEKPAKKAAKKSDG